MRGAVVIYSTPTLQHPKLMTTILCPFKQETDLSYPVVLQFDNSWNCHLHATKYGHNFQDFIIKRWGPKYLKGKENIPFSMVNPVHVKW